MKDTCYLVVDPHGVRRMTKRSPVLEGGEVAIRLCVSVADRHFPAVLAEHEVTVRDPSITLYQPWGIGVHGSDLLPLMLLWRSRT